MASLEETLAFTASATSFEQRAARKTVAASFGATPLASEHTNNRTIDQLNNNNTKVNATKIEGIVGKAVCLDTEVIAAESNKVAACLTAVAVNAEETFSVKGNNDNNDDDNKSTGSSKSVPSIGENLSNCLFGLVIDGEPGVSNILGGGGHMFSDVFEGKGGELDAGPLEDLGASGSDGSDRNCKLCSSRLVVPRVLSCLHVFCESCLKHLINDDSGFGNSASSTSSDSSMADLKPSMKQHLECPTCKQLTKLGPNGVESLLCDYILTNILDLSAIESEQLSCTSCKSKEKAISRCNDCANFLCGGCDNAHKYMRCFENHEVVKLEDLQKSAHDDKSLTIHKPLFCHSHPAENLKYYCFSCQTPVCNDCLIAEHKGSEHHYDVMAVAEALVRTDVESLMKEAVSKTQYCDAAAANLSSALNELQSKHDCARDRIEETYQLCKKILEKCREHSLHELDKLHSERELKIMDLLQNIENTMGKIDGTCKFTQRVLDQANAAEFLSMKKLISNQFMHLINNTPKCDVNYSLVFDSNVEKFDQLAQDIFGRFRTESTPPSPKECTPPPTLPGMPPSLMSGASGRNMLNSSASTHAGTVSGSVTASSPISLPNSMQSSFDGDLSGLGGNFMMPNVLTPESPSQQPGAMHHAAAMQHHHQQQQQHLQQQQQQQQQSQTAHSQMNGYNGLGGAPNGGLGPAGLVGGPANATSLNGLMGVINNVTAALKAGGPNGGGVPSSPGPLNMGPMNGGSLANGGGGPHMNGGGPNGGVPPAYNSILEYNLSRLASMTETTPDVLGDALVAPGSGPPQNGHHHLHHSQAVVPATGTTPPNLSLAELLGGDARAISNLQALAKINFNNNNAPSPSIGSLPPLGPGPVDDMSLSNFHAAATPGTTSIVTGRNKAIPMQIRCKFGALGTSKAQFNSPHGFCLGVDEEIIVADTNNHRIEVFDKTGALKFMFGVPGKEEGQLWYPRKVAVMHNNGKFVVCDRGNERSRMQVFSKCGHFMRKIVIRYIDIVAGLAVTSKGHIVAVDSVSPTVFVISEEGDLVRWFDCSDYMREPSDIAIRDNDFYVCDFKGHCVAVFQEDGTFQYRIGNEKVTCFPNGIDISNDGDILIGDSHGNRFHVACYSRDGVLQSEYECPHVKVSRCCGLKITSEGYVVTLAKNNHHVLVLNTLYVH